MSLESDTWSNNLKLPGTGAALVHSCCNPRTPGMAAQGQKGKKAANQVCDVASL